MTAITRDTITAPLSVSIVEDEMVTRTLIADELLASGYEVSSYENAEMAWNAFLSQPCQIALVDVVLPGMNGLELCRRIRRLPHGDDCVIIVTTIRNQPGDIESVIDAGADDYLTKPIDLALLHVRLAIARRKVLERTARSRAIRAQEEMLAKFQHTQKLESLGIMAGGIAHEFNNLLMGILGNAGLAVRAIEEETSVLGCLREIERTALRAAELVQQLLAYSGKRQRTVHPVNITAMVEEIKPLIITTVGGHAEVCFDLFTGDPVADVDIAQIRQVLMNLINNAADAIDSPGGWIRVTTGMRCVDQDELDAASASDDLDPGDYTFIEVADSGVGMDALMLERIFDPFYTTKFLGRGLGLAAALGIVRAHHGAILVQSAPKAGSVFRIYIPPSRHPHRATIAKTHHTRDWRGEGLVLIADSQESDRARAQMTLEAYGFATLLASTMEETLALFESHAGDTALLLLESGLDNHDNGSSIINIIRERRPDLPVIMAASTVDMAAAARDGVVLLHKPVPPRILVNKVWEMLQG